MFKRQTFSFRLISSFLIVLFTNLTLFPCARAAGLNLPAPNQFISLSVNYSFPLIRGLKLDPLDPFKVEFIVDTADKSKKTISKDEASSLIKYFLAGLTIPEKDIWVNLSPYEKNRIIPESTAATDLGKGLLSQDYILKQLLSSLTYPESATGKSFWSKTYKEISKTADINNLSVDTFNKIWIVPDEAVVRQNNNTALITKASLKAMLEEDYLALSHHNNNRPLVTGNQVKEANKTASDIMKQTILPKINKDINQGKNFANLRQIYHSLILGIWFKKKFQDSVYKHYIDKGKIAGIDLKDKKIKDKIYSQYLKAFQKGVYDYIKSEYQPASNKQVKRRYYSGGITITSGFSLASSGIANPLVWMIVEQGISSPMARDSFMGNPLNIPTKIVGLDGKGKVLTVNLKEGASSSIDNAQNRFQAHLPEQRISMSRKEGVPSVEAMIAGMEEFFSERGKGEFSREVKAAEGTMIAVQKIRKGRYLLQCPLGDISLFLPSDSAELVFSIDSLDRDSLTQLTVIFLRLLRYGYVQATLDEDKIFPFISIDSENHDKLFKLFGYYQYEGKSYSNRNGDSYEEDEVEVQISKILTEKLPDVSDALNKLTELSIEAYSTLIIDDPIPEFLKDKRAPYDIFKDRLILTVSRLERELKQVIEASGLGLEPRFKNAVRVACSRGFDQIMLAINPVLSFDEEMLLKVVEDNVDLLKKSLPEELGQGPKKRLELKLKDAQDEIAAQIKKGLPPVSRSSSIIKVTLSTEIQVADVKDIKSQIKRNMKKFFKDGVNKLDFRNYHNAAYPRKKTFMFVDSETKEHSGGFELYFGNNPMRYVSWEWVKESDMVYPQIIITIDAESETEADTLKDIFASLSVRSMRQVADNKGKNFKQINWLDVERGTGGNAPAKSENILPRHNSWQAALADLDNSVLSSSLNKEEPGIKQIDGGIALKDISAKFEAQADSIASSPAWNVSFEAGELKGFSFDMGEIEQVGDLEEVFKPALAKEAARLP